MDSQDDDATQRDPDTPSSVEKPKPAKSTNKKSAVAKTIAQAEEDEDAFLNYSPLKCRNKATEKKALPPPPLNLSTNEESSKTENKSNKKEEMAPKPEDDFALQALMKIDKLDDLVLGQRSKANKKHLWPLRRIRSMLGLNSSTIKALEQRRLINNLVIRDDVYAIISGDPKAPWYIMDKSKSKLVKFTDPAERARIEKYLSTGKDSEAKNQLRAAMDVAQKMYEACLKRIEEENARKAAEPIAFETPDDDQDPVEEANVAETIPARQALLPHQRYGIEDKPRNVKFEPGMVISVQRPNMKTEKLRIVEISRERRAYRVLLQDGSLLVDDIRVGAGNNKVMHLWSELKKNSDFVQGRDGVDMATLISTKVEQGKAKLEKQFKRMKQDLGDA